MTHNPVNISIHMHTADRAGFDLTRIGAAGRRPFWTLDFESDGVDMAVVYLSAAQLGELAGKVCEAAQQAGTWVDPTPAKPAPALTFDEAREMLQRFGYTDEWIDRTLNELIP